jgi:hypothetical protein
MVDLSDYLGHILCEVTRARVMADMEALRVAQEYAGDEAGLLRHFPVPRMRLPTLEITVPVQINDMPEGYVERTRADTASLAKVLADELGPALKKHNLKIAIADISKTIKDDPELSRGRLVEGLADSLSMRLYDHTKALSKEKEAAISDDSPSGREALAEISNTIRERVDQAISALPRQPVGIAIEPKTSAIREVGDPALLLNVRLTITEDALEIQLAEDETADLSEGTKPIPPRIRRLVSE